MGNTLCAIANKGREVEGEGTEGSSILYGTTMQKSYELKTE